MSRVQDDLPLEIDVRGVKKMLDEKVDFFLLAAISWPSGDFWAGLSQFGKVTYFEASKLLLDEVLWQVPPHFVPSPLPACESSTRYSDEMVVRLCVSVGLDVVAGF
ncbi:MAG TPA: hypothetical protein VMM76_22260 [Pirellulaceae bacterium]|nr:hypothetical protein [Pirellulaceae bacterium]